MELDYYKNFVTIVDTGTITGAAAKIGIAQSALSKQVQNLEATYGTTLINKTKGPSKGISLTDAGKLFYDKSKALCNLENNMHREIVNYNSGYRGTLAIAIAPALSESLVRNELAAFHEAYKDVSFLLKEDSSVEQEKDLQNNITEIGITNSPIPHPYDFEVIKAIKMQYYVFINKETTRLDLSKPYFTLQDLANIPLCLSQSSSRLIIDSMANNNIPINLLSSFSHRRTTLAWIDKDYGVAVFPTTAGNLPKGSIKSIPLHLDGATPKQTVYKLKGKKLSALAERFISSQILNKENYINQKNEYLW